MIRLTRPACPNPVALKTNYRHPENKDALRSASSDKCMYCESKVSAVYFGDVEHIHPKRLFPELEFDWENHGFVCARCNNAKRDQWHHDTPYINPYDEDPGDHLAAVGALILHRGGSERGEVTCRDVDLNRSDLVEARQARIDALHTLIDKVNRTKDEELRKTLSKELEQEAGEDLPYTLVSRAALTGLK